MIYEMTKVALYIAPGKMDEWEKSDIESMVEECGIDATVRFLDAYEWKFGVNLERQRDYALMAHRGD